MDIVVSWDDVLETWGIAEREYTQAVASSSLSDPATRDLLSDLFRIHMGTTSHFVELRAGSAVPECYERASVAFVVSLPSLDTLGRIPDFPVLPERGRFFVQ
jgi:hypothetical protein